MVGIRGGEPDPYGECKTGSARTQGPRDGRRAGREGGLDLFRDESSRRSWLGHRKGPRYRYRGLFTIHLPSFHLLRTAAGDPRTGEAGIPRSEEHTSELQSRENLVCRLLLEKKKKKSKL